MRCLMPFDCFDECEQGRRQALRNLSFLAAAVCATSPAAWAVSKGAAPQRIVSIGGALTEIIWALGVGTDLVGVDTTSLYPAAVTKLPSVGYARSLSSEGILALAPTQVVATEDAGPPAVLRQISSAGVPVSILAANHRFEGVLERVSRMGSLLGRAAQASQLASTLQNDWHRVRQSILTREGRSPRVLFVLSHSPNQVMVGGKNSSAAAMIEYAGASNAVQEFDGFKPLTPEAVIAAKPDIVLLTDQGLGAIGGINGALKLPGLNQTPAGQKRRVIALEAMFMLGFGPRLPAAVSELNAAISKAMKA